MINSSIFKKKTLNLPKLSLNESLNTQMKKPALNQNEILYIKWCMEINEFMRKFVLTMTQMISMSIIILYIYQILQS